METANEEAAVVGEEITSCYVRCAGTELYVSFFSLKIQGIMAILANLKLVAILLPLHAES